MRISSELMGATIDAIKTVDSNRLTMTDEQLRGYLLVVEGIGTNAVNAFLESVRDELDDVEADAAYRRITNGVPLPDSGIPIKRVLLPGIEELTLLPTDTLGELGIKVLEAKDIDRRTLPALLPDSTKIDTTRLVYMGRWTSISGEFHPADPNMEVKIAIHVDTVRILSSTLVWDLLITSHNYDPTVSVEQVTDLHLTVNPIQQAR